MTLTSGYGSYSAAHVLDPSTKPNSEITPPISSHFTDSTFAVTRKLITVGRKPPILLKVYARIWFSWILLLILIFICATMTHIPIDIDSQYFVGGVQEGGQDAK